MVQSSNESQQTQTFSIDHENVLPEHYRLIELIGRGGMAEVYLAEDRRLGRKVAIKFLNPEFRRDPDRVRRFRQEARSASALNHPNILIIHDIGDSGGVQFIVSELVEGETLGTRIAHGKLPFAEAVDIAIQAASALTAAHAAGIVHRDIKPDNVMIRRDGVVKVLDFGLAKARGFTTLNGGDFDALTLDSGSTSPGLIVGTPQYMSPEQARGKELDGRTDIFSLGIIIFEMVTRHSPFASGSFADTMAAILTKEPRRLEEFVQDAPPRLTALIEKCLKKPRDERFSSMAEVETELKLLRRELAENPRETAEFDPVKSDRTQIRPTDQHSVRRYMSETFRKPSPIAAVIIVAAAALLMAGWWAWDRVAVTSTAPSLMRTVPITSWSSSASELVSAASFSPDGRLVAFAARKGDATEIWVKPVVGGDPVQVTKNGGYNQYPVWSVDSQQIAFFSDRGNSWGIWRIPFTGGNISKVLGGVTASARPIHWGKDGDIYFQSVREVYKVAQNSEEATRVADFSNLGSNVRTIEVSGDERSLAYSVKEETGWKLKVRGLAGGDEIQIASTNDQIDHIAWHPNSRSVFCSVTVEGALQIVEAAVDGSSVAQRSNGNMDFVVHDVAENGSVLYGSLSETSDLWRIDTRDGKESVVANDVASEFWPDVAADGSIAFQSVTRVERPERGSVKVAAVSPEPSLATVSTSGFGPTWSNRGDWIAFFLRDDSGLTVWKSRPSGIDPTRISSADITSPIYYFAPYIKSGIGHLAWSPDDSVVAFVIKEGDRLKIWLSSSDGSLSGRLLNPESTDDDWEGSPLWSADGKVIYHTAGTRAVPPSRERLHRIRMTNIETGVQRLLYESKEPIRILGFGGNGQTLIFAKRTDPSEMIPAPPSTEILSLSLQTREAQKIGTVENAYVQNIHLSDDGNSIAFVSRMGELTKLSITTTGSQASRDLLVINDPKVMVSSLAFSPDGNFIAFGKQTRTNSLSMLTK